LSISWHLDVEPRPTILVLPPAAASLDEAHAAIELWEHYSRKTLDPTQRLTVEVMMAQRADGNWAAQTTGREMPRQNGKGDEVEVVELWDLVQRAAAILHTIHDAVLLATQTQERMLGVLESHPDLRRKVKRKWTGTGQQMIEMRNGGIIWYRTRTGGGGRGVDDIDRLVVDEAQHATEEQLAAMTPTLFANSNPQMNLLGTAGLEGKSASWWKIRRRALSDNPGAFGYVGHTAESVHVDADGQVIQIPPDVNDRQTWIDANPALASGRGQGMAFLEEQLQNLGPDIFAQEHLCVWAPPVDSTNAGPIAIERWQSLTDGESLPVDGTERLALDVTPDRRFSTFGIAGKRADGLGHVSVRHREPGTSWVVERAKVLAEGHRTPIVVVKGSPAESLVPDLELAGVPVDLMSHVDYAGACQRFVDAVNAHEPLLRHRGSPDHTAAVSAAQIKPAGDGGFVWSRKSTSSDITPLTTATAAWARVGHGEPDEFWFY